MPGFTYVLELLEPLLANSLAGDANSAQSLPYVPGSLIRGALINVYRQTHQLDGLKLLAGGFAGGGDPGEAA